jgi:hypothetical protein
MADLPGLSGLRNPTGNRAFPAGEKAGSLANRQLLPTKNVSMAKMSGRLAPFSGTASAGPSSLRNEWRRRRALAEHTAEDMASLNIDSSSRTPKVSDYRLFKARFCSTTRLNYLLWVSVANSIKLTCL